MSRLEDVNRQMRDTAARASETVSDTMNRQREAAAERLGRAASAIHDRADRVPGGASASTVVHRLADGMESTAGYLHNHDFTDMKEDAITLCRRHPAQTLIAALAAGFVLGRLIRR